MNPELRYWQAVLRAAEAELDAAATNSDLQVAARRFMRARREVTRLTKHEASRAAKPPRRPSRGNPLGAGRPEPPSASGSPCS